LARLVDKPCTSLAGAINVRAVPDRDDVDHAGESVEAIEDPIRTATRRQHAFELSDERLPKAVRVVLDRDECLEDCRRSLLR
jgi:hypothetical protein